jgi:hypothetical protein|tara:strand:- start:29 stop:232 length:204 start_codon:yes stop_codon:yes gene_type:complete
MAKIDDLIPKDVLGFSADGIPFPQEDAKGLFTLDETLTKLIWIVKEQGELIESLRGDFIGLKEEIFD